MGLRGSQDPQPVGQVQKDQRTCVGRQPRLGMVMGTHHPRTRRVKTQ
jgi:hypothetical protein